MQCQVILASASDPLGITTGLYPSTPGVWITSVAPGSAADRGGVDPGRQILSCNGEEVVSQAGLRDVVSRAKASGHLSLVFYLGAWHIDDERQRSQGSSTSGRPRSAAPPRSSQARGAGGKRPIGAPVQFRIKKGSLLSTGLQFSEVWDETEQWLEVTGCAHDSPAALAGVMRGQLRAVNHRAVHVKDDVMEALQLKLSGVPEGDVIIDIAPFEIMTRTLEIVPPRDTSEDLGLVFKADENGVRTIQVVPGSAGDQAGIRAFRRVFAVNGVKPVLHPSSEDTGRELAGLITQARAVGNIRVEIETSEEELNDEAEALRLAGCSTQDAHGYFWVAVPGASALFAVQRHHICYPGGSPVHGAPQVGTEVVLTGLSEAQEAGMNGMIGTLQPPGKMRADEFDAEAAAALADAAQQGGRQVVSTPASSSYQGAFDKHTAPWPPTWPYTTPASQSLVKKMLSPRGSTLVGGGGGSDASRGGGGVPKRQQDWKAWIVRNSGSAVAQRAALQRGPEAPSRKVPVVFDGRRGERR